MGPRELVSTRKHLGKQLVKLELLAITTGASTAVVRRAAFGHPAGLPHFIAFAGQASDGIIEDITLKLVFAASGIDHRSPRYGQRRHPRGFLPIHSKSVVPSELINDQNCHTFSAVLND